MLKTTVQLVAVVSALTVFVEQSSAQRMGGNGRTSGGGCNRAAAAGTGGPSRVGGMQTMAAAGFMSNAAMLGQMSAMNRMGPQNTLRNMQTSGNRPPRPTPEQFVQAAGRFDVDRDGLLNREELSQVATAVIAELRQRPGRGHRSGPDRVGRQSPANAARAADSRPTVEDMTETFMARALTFDADDDGALNQRETRALAAALIRSLG